MQTVRIGSLEISRFILGGNPFSGFAHQTAQRSEEMLNYYTVERIKEEYRKAERLGVTAHIGRVDHHVMRTLREYWNEGGTIKWIAQTCPMVGTPEQGVRNAIAGRAAACFIHGGLMDNYLAEGKLDAIPPVVEMIRAAGMPAGVAGHDPRVFLWAEEHLDVDFYMCSHYRPAKRAGGEVYDESDREAMLATVQRLTRPVIHYKILAAGRNDPKEAFMRTVRAMRPGDAVCVGIYAGDNPNMLAEDIQLFEAALTSAGQLPASS